MPYRVGGSWGRTLVWVPDPRVEPDANGRRPDDFLLAMIDSRAEPELTQRIVDLLNADDRHGLLDRLDTL